MQICYKPSALTVKEECDLMAPGCVLSLPCRQDVMFALLGGSCPCVGDPISGGVAGQADFSAACTAHTRHYFCGSIDIGQYFC